MRRNLFVFAALLAVLGASLQAHAVTSCTAGNPNTISVAETTPTSAFTDNGDGTVTHDLTGLMWKRCAEGQVWNGATCTGSAMTFIWSDALLQAKNANFASHADWRLPNKKELESIAEMCGWAPAINQTIFPATPPSAFWSGSAFADLASNHAWDVNFNEGVDDHYIKNTSNYYVRLVRGGQLFDTFDAQKEIQIITFDPAPTVVVGVTGSVSATGGASGNPVTFTSITPGVCTTSGANGSTVTGVSTGTCTIVAEQAGNASFNTAQAQAQDFTIGEGGIDLTVSALSSSVDGGSAGIGDPITINATITNGGTAPISQWIGIPVFYYLSTDNVITMSDTLLSGRFVNGLAAGASSSSHTTVTTPSNLAPGTYYIGAIVDPANYHHESSESNNSRSTLTPFTLVRDVDLTVSALSSSADAGNVNGGGSVTIHDTVTNAGTTATTAWSFTVRYYLSTDNVITKDDMPLGDRYINGFMPAGADSIGSATFNLPTPLAPGTYYIGAIVDALGNQPENNEGNNSRATSIAFTVVRDVDLALSALTSTPNDGGSITIHDTVTNSGSTSTTAWDFTVRYYLSTDNVITKADMPLGDRYINGLLPAGASSSGSRTITLPSNLASGTYFVGAIVDVFSQQPEFNEANNTRVSTTTFDVVHEVDLTVSALSSTSEGAYIYADGPVTIHDTVTNIGTSATTAWSLTVRYYLSTDNAITSADMPIGDRYITGYIPAGASNSGTITLTLPSSLAPGSYYIGAIVDALSQQPENFESNNRRATVSHVYVHAP